MQNYISPLFFMSVNAGAGALKGSAIPRSKDRMIDLCSWGKDSMGKGLCWKTIPEMRALIRTPFMTSQFVNPGLAYLLSAQEVAKSGPD